ncbi:hypothetical protein TREES_T100016904 [Tupaia chinensis]|uniref:Uncharacterized protein n=1 Tax=Tupaia chinensis TaxID=246437 RepID=L9L1L2_TUPCH|nr:hypothetical protein TREES_T100016904 [Tupaia chinensis]
MSAFHIVTDEEANHSSNSNLPGAASSLCSNPTLVKNTLGGAFGGPGTCTGKGSLSPTYDGTDPNPHFRHFTACMIDTVLYVHFNTVVSKEIKLTGVSVVNSCTDLDLG